MEICQDTNICPLLWQSACYRFVYEVSRRFVRLMTWTQHFSSLSLLKGRTKFINDALCWMCWSNLECNSSETYWNCVLYLMHCPFERVSGQKEREKGKWEMITVFLFLICRVRSELWPCYGMISLWIWKWLSTRYMYMFTVIQTKRLYTSN